MFTFKTLHWARSSFPLKKKKKATNFPERGLLPTVNGGRVFKKYSNYSHKIKFKPNSRAEEKHMQINEKTTDFNKIFFTENESFFLNGYLGFPVK